MNIRFTKAHGALNDFLLSREEEVPAQGRAELARALCDRHAGVGADGWLLVSPAGGPDADAAIELFNSDGSRAEISGNGTRCAAAFLLHEGPARGEIRIRTGAGVKRLRLVGRDGLAYRLEMDMGRAEILQKEALLPLAGGPRRAVVLDMGNPQCAVPVEDFGFDWRAVGAEIESHPMFPARTNVSFLRRAGAHAIEARFFERGAGETMSSGTGSAGAAAAAAALGWVSGAVEVRTPAGPLEVRLGPGILLTGPAVLVARGEFLVD